MPYRTDGSTERSPCCTVKLVSVAPRSSRLNSVELAALALPSHPALLAGVPSALAMEQEESIGDRARSFSRSMPPRAASTIGLVGDVVSASASAKSVSSAKCTWASRFAKKRTSSSSSSDRTRASESTIAGHDDHRPIAGRNAVPHVELGELPWRYLRRDDQIQQADGQLAHRQQRQRSERRPAA